jgi:hypothetical protein
VQFFQKGKMQVLGGEFIVFYDDHYEMQSGEVRESWYEAQGVFERAIDTDVQICGARRGVLRESDEAKKLMVVVVIVTKKTRSLHHGHKSKFGQIWSRC